MSKDKMDLIWGIVQMEKELAKSHSHASNIMNISTEVIKQVQELQTQTSLNWETTIYPIVKDVLENNTAEEDISDKEVVILSNMICQTIDKKYKIEEK